MATAMTHLTNLRILFCPANHHPVATASPLFLSPLRYKSSSKLSSSFSLFFKPKTQFLLQPAHPINTPADNKLPLLFNLRASYSKRTMSDSSYSRSPSSRIKHRRSNSSLSGSDRKNNNTKQKGGVAMDFEEGSDSSVSVEPNVGFNRKRALGRDKNDTAKRNLQLKVRKLNPVNTICYVQVNLFVASSYGYVELELLQDCFFILPMWLFLVLSYIIAFFLVCELEYLFFLKKKQK